MTKLEKQGKMTEQDAHIVLNAPILKVGKGAPLNFIYFQF